MLRASTDQRPDSFVEPVAAMQNTTEGRMTMAQQRPRRMRFLGRALALAAVIGLGAAVPAQAEDPGLVPGSFKISVSDSQAGGHPDVFTEFRFKSRQGQFWGMPMEVPVDDVRDVEVDLPPGLVGNPENFPKCAASRFPQCPVDTQIGEATLEFLALLGEVTTPIYNIEPPQGAVAQFAFNGSAGVLVQITASVRSDGDYGLTMTTRNTPDLLPVLGVKLDFWGVPTDPAHTLARDRMCDAFSCTRASAAPAIVPYPAGGVPSGITQRPFMTAPVQCGVATRATIKANTWGHPAFDHAETTIPAFTGCDKLSFQPRITTRPTNRTAAAPTGLDVDIQVPQNNAVPGLSTPPLKDAVVTLPEGMVVSPSGSDGLEACTDAQLGVGSLAKPACPKGSQIGTVRIESPPLSEDLTGVIYLGNQTPDQLLRIFLFVEGGGVQLKLPGKIDPDPVTGRLTTTFADQPMLPANRIQMSFKSGPRAVLANPSTCGPKTTEAQLTSHGGQVANLTDTFEITAGCHRAGAFTPSIGVGALTARAGASSPFALDVTRADGQPAINGLSMVLPPGLTANLRGNIGTQVGSAHVAAGPGANPFWLSGPVTLEGPYKDAPFSLRVAIPAKAGPIDLGLVVVRQRIYVDPKDAHVTIVSDPLPTILQGIPIQLQKLRVDIDKGGFMVNPTSCEPMSLGATLQATNGASVPVVNRFQVGDCGGLGLDPDLSMAFTNSTQMREGRHPGVEANLGTISGDANLKQVEATLPLAVALDPNNARGLCEPADAEAHRCPAESIIGHATANTPLLDVPVSGPVFFVKGFRTGARGQQIATLPKLYMRLSGQGVNINVWADSSVSGRVGRQHLVTTFVDVPDVPISDFQLRINSGRNGILKATTNVCGAPKGTGIEYTGHNGKVKRVNIQATAAGCRPQVVSSSTTRTAVTVRVGGIGAGRLSVSGPRIRNASRNIRRADAATIKTQLRLTASQRRQLSQGRSVRVALRVAFRPASGKTVTLRRNVTVAGVRRN